MAGAYLALTQVLLAVYTQTTVEQRLTPNGELKSRGISVQIAGILIFVAGTLYANNLSEAGIPPAATIAIVLILSIAMFSHGRKIYVKGKRGIPEGAMVGGEGITLLGLRMGVAVFSTFLLWDSLFRLIDALSVFWRDPVKADLTPSWAYTAGAVTSSAFSLMVACLILRIVWPHFSKAKTKIIAWSFALLAGLAWFAVAQAGARVENDLLKFTDAELGELDAGRWAESDFLQGKRRLMSIDAIGSDTPGVFISRIKEPCMMAVKIDTQLAEREKGSGVVEFAEAYNRMMVKLVCPQTGGGQDHGRLGRELGGESK